MVTILWRLFVPFFALLLPFSAWADAISPALRLTVSLRDNGRAKQINNKAFCSGSLVRHLGQTYFATAKHCFQSVETQVMFYMLVRNAAARSYKSPSIGISLQKYSGRLSTLGDLLNFSFKESPNLDGMFLHGMFAFDNGEQEDGLLISSSLLNQLSGSGVTVLELATAQQFERESQRVRIEGFPRGSYRNFPNCQRVTKEQILNSLPNQCRQFIERSFSALEEIRKNKNNIAYQCEIQNRRHPGGMSGGPAISEQGHLIGAASSAAHDLRTARQARQHSIGFMLSGATEEEIRETDRLTQECYPHIDNVIWVAPLNPSLLRGISGEL